MSIKSGQRYKFTNEETGVVFDLFFDSVPDRLTVAKHMFVVGWAFHGLVNQQWITEKHNDGQWTILSVMHQKYLGFENTPKDGTPLVGLDRPQLWDIEILPDSEDHDNPRVRLWVRGTLLVVEYPKGRSSGGPLQMWGVRDGNMKNQVWVLEEYS